MEKNVKLIKALPLKWTYCILKHSWDGGGGVLLVKVKAIVPVLLDQISHDIKACRHLKGNFKFCTSIDFLWIFPFYRKHSVHDFGPLLIGSMGIGFLYENMFSHKAFFKDFLIKNVIRIAPLYIGYGINLWTITQLKYSKRGYKLVKNIQRPQDLLEIGWG